MSTTENSDIVIVKLGGAAITNKKGVCELAPERQLEEMFDQVQSAYQVLNRSGKKLVLIHGAGCFGHPQAKQYKLKPGWKHIQQQPDSSYIKGYSHIRSCLQQLSHAMISRLESRNVPVLAMSPIDYIETTNCEETTTKEFEYLATRVHKYLKLGFVPVLHGDAVLDRIRGCTILSGDIIMYQLSQLLNTVVRCIYITDVHGVYQTDPKLDLEGSKNALISRVVIDKHELEVSAKEEEIDSKLADVTGGMQGKIKWARKITSDTENPLLETIICKWGSKEAFDMMTLESSLTKNNYEMTVFTQK